MKEDNLSMKHNRARQRAEKEQPHVPERLLLFCLYMVFASCILCTRIGI